MLFHNFHWLSIEAALAHRPVILKEVQELLAKKITEPFTGGAGFYSNVFVVPKHLGSLLLFLILSDLTAGCTHLLLGCLLLNRYDNLLNRVIILPLLILRMFT